MVRHVGPSGGLADLQEAVLDALGGGATGRLEKILC